MKKFMLLSLMVLGVSEVVAAPSRVLPPTSSPSQMCARGCPRVNALSGVALQSQQQARQRCLQRCSLMN